MHLSDIVMTEFQVVCCKNCRNDICGEEVPSLSHFLNIIFPSIFLLKGAPIKGETVPIRLYLSKLNLTPTYRSINNVYSVKYFINLVLVDEEDRRYFKQQEIFFWRCADVSGANQQPGPGSAVNVSRKLSLLPSAYRPEKVEAPFDVPIKIETAT